MLFVVFRNVPFHREVRIAVSTSNDKTEMMPPGYRLPQIFLLLTCVIVGLTTGDELQKFFGINVCCFISEQLLFVELGSYDVLALSPLRGAVEDLSLRILKERPRLCISVSL